MVYTDQEKSRVLENLKSKLLNLGLPRPSFIWILDNVVDDIEIDAFWPKYVLQLSYLHEDQVFVLSKKVYSLEKYIGETIPVDNDDLFLDFVRDISFS